MSGDDGVLLGRAELERAFTALGERLASRGVIADVFVVGGAAMALAYDAKRLRRSPQSRAQRPTALRPAGQVIALGEPALRQALAVLV
jgi:hypothetical protein